jgi:diguanylate cyclase
VKLDRSFVTALERDPDSRTLIEATISLAHALGLHVVAEGVEEEGTLNLLARLGCDLAQGYYIARPMPAADLALGQSLVA